MIQKAQQAKADKSLLKTIRREDGRIITAKEWLQELLNEGYLPFEDKKPSVKWNRVKYNRMDGRQQEAYDKQLNTLIPAYWARNGSLMFELNKTQFNYLLELSEGERYFM